MRRAERDSAIAARDGAERRAQDSNERAEREHTAWLRLQADMAVIEARLADARQAATESAAEHARAIDAERERLAELQQDQTLRAAELAGARETIAALTERLERTEPARIDATASAKRLEVALFEAKTLRRRGRVRRTGS